MVEDFTTYTEGGTDAGLLDTTTATQVGVTNVSRGANIFVYKDFGASYFDNVTHDIEVKVDAIASTGSNFGFWAIGDTLGDGADLLAGDADMLYVSAANAGFTTYNLQLVCRRTATADTFSSAVTLDIGTQYYGTVTRTGTTVTLDIFSDEAKTVQVGSTITAVGTGTSPSRYLYPLFSRGVSSTDITAQSRNLDINEASAGGSGVLSPFMRMELTNG